MSWGPPEPKKPKLDVPEISYSQVAEKYSALSSKEAFNGPASQNLEYPEDLRALVPASVWGTSCGGGNPFALGRPSAGQAVADMGCGAGVDLCVSAALVGAAGRVLGVDANRDMLNRALENTKLTADSRPNVADVTLVQAPFDDPSHASLSPHLGLYDIVVSNGALCLSFDKMKALKTAFDLLRPGGRFQLFDLCQVDDTVPPGLGQWTQESWYTESDKPTVESWANWVSGCELPAELVGKLQAVGFDQVEMKGWTAFMTSSKTRGALFSARRPIQRQGWQIFRNGKLVPTRIDGDVDMGS